MKEDIEDATKHASHHLEVESVRDPESTKDTQDNSERPVGTVSIPSRLTTKIDLHILPTMTVIYIMSFLDRINFGSALVYGLRRDLDLHGPQANVCISVFFAAYVAFEIPATILIKRLKPRVCLSTCMFFFGLLTLVQGFTKGFGGLLALRFLLGIAEAAIFPGCFYLMSMWYRRDRAQKRFSSFFSGASFAGAFGGLLASAIGKMDGVAGYAAWRWIFILEGTLTCVLALVFWFTIADFPESVRWLSNEEKSLITQALVEDQGPSGIEEKITVRSVINVLKDINVILGAPLYFCIAFSAYGLAFFIPSIIAGFGFSPIKTQLYSVAPWSCTLVLSLLIAYLSDKTQRRFFYILGCLGLALVGNLMLFNIRGNVHASYAGVFLSLMGVVTAAPLTVCWYAMSLRGHQEKAIGIPWQVGLGNAAGIASTFAFPPQDAPEYVLAYSLGIGFLCLAAVIAISYYLRCGIANKRLGYRRYYL